MKNSDKATCGDFGGHGKDGEPCEYVAGWGTDFEDGKCKKHRGTSPDGESHKNNDHAQSHGLHTSAETFFANAPERHLDTYYAYHESLCDRWATQHNSYNKDGSPDVPYQPRKDLGEVAFEMAKLDMAKEYQAEHAVDPEKPITEKQLRDVGGDPMEVEAVSKVEKLKTDIRRENRLLLKDMGIYQSPEKQAAEATETLAEILSDES